MITDEIKIEKGIPIPTIRRSGWMDFAKKLEIGDSVLLENNSSVSPLRNSAKKLGIKLCSSKDKNGVRVWRIE